VSVFGKFGSRVMVEMSATTAGQLFTGLPENSSHTRLVEAIENDLDEIRRRAPEVADSAIAASAIAMATEMENPYNSATSKSMCARVLIDSLDRLRELAPAPEGADRLDDLSSRRQARLAGSAKT